MCIRDRYRRGLSGVPKWSGGRIGTAPVSYTHLDVYKRQEYGEPKTSGSIEKGLTVTVPVKNTGSVAGAEIVQILSLIHIFEVQDRHQCLERPDGVDGHHPECYAVDVNDAVGRKRAVCPRDDTLVGDSGSGPLYEP